MFYHLVYYVGCIFLSKVEIGIYQWEMLVGTDFYITFSSNEKHKFNGGF